MGVDELLTGPRSQSKPQAVPEPVACPLAVPSTYHCTVAGGKLSVAAKEADVVPPETVVAAGVRLVTAGAADKPGFGTVADCSA